LGVADCAPDGILGRQLAVLTQEVRCVITGPRETLDLLRAQAGRLGKGQVARLTGGAYRVFLARCVTTQAAVQFGALHDHVFAGSGHVAVAALEVHAERGFLCRDDLYVVEPQIACAWYAPLPIDARGNTSVMAGRTQSRLRKRDGVRIDVMAAVAAREHALVPLMIELRGLLGDRRGDHHSGARQHNRCLNQPATIHRTLPGSEPT
jgi:hypothetical protein